MGNGSASAGTDRGQDLLGLGVAPRGLLRVDEVSVHDHLEDPATRRGDLQIGDLVLELGEQLVRQTDGSRCVASLSAVLDRYLHGGRFYGPGCGSRRGAALLYVDIDNHRRSSWVPSAG